MKKIILISIFLIVMIILIFNIIKLNKKDNVNTEEKYYIQSGAIYEKTGDINKSAVENNISKINSICDKYLNNMNIYFSIIPDKEYYLKKSINTEFVEIENTVISNLNKSTKYFSIKDLLSLEDFYKTDMHWKQENMQDIVENIEKELDADIKSDIDYEVESLGDFFGSYYTKIENNNILSDELKYLNNSVIKNCKVYNEETKTEEKIYNLEKVNESKNKYDLFLSGATAITTITNEKANTDKKLILFRDSFGSSIAPLLVKDYKELILIDIRYVNSTILENYIDFNKYKEADVLFLYSSRVINKSGIFR